ncbi:MAG: hypothetical protein QOH21_3749 [Acidobacteriota bacterium]|jgi:hypothetical protein|nr:hypothetical protein [Acidobacteriota bacterium]
MILRHRFTTTTLYLLGLSFVIAGNVLQRLIDRAGRSTDLTDFALGVLFGIGIGMLLLVLWRGRRDCALR